ncbi:ABC transporter permease protein [Octadecabacter antarcticus 307]|uniref:ABC transporter permease protein n=1 Tax=Octadecabacter antarcticus 307 TaxID=391626 RepID=M9R7M1_9RHOB|nr:branched-chain amino acid ABC transporter permease [Octadecabacter antarcticus]AGI68659.1 ABC transporter permease protein [Octadecabacter antarcticus 307]
MSTYQIRTMTRGSRISLSLVVIGLLALLALPLTGDRGTMRLVVEIAYFLALAQMWNLLAGYAGLLSVGQHAFIGFGGYMLFALVIHAGLPPIWSLPLAGLITAAISIPVGLIVFRLAGPYFAIGTWVVAEVFKLAFFEVSALGGGSGVSLPLDAVRSIADSREGRELTIYLCAIAIATASTLGVWALLRSRLGLGLTAIRDNPVASASIGIDTFRLRFSVFVAVAGITGMIGALIFLQKLRISPVAAFDVMEWSAAVIFMVVIGGIGRIEGPFVGVAVYFLLRELLSDYGTWYLIALGLFAIILMLFARQGLWGLIANRWGLSVFPVNRHIEISTSYDPKTEESI